MSPPLVAAAPVPFATAWLSGQPRARQLLAGCDARTQRVAAARRAAERPIAPALLAELLAQQRALPPSAARERSLALLGRPGSAVVVTGQQVGLFLGPLYTVHKAASAIAVAAALERESGVPTVPLFWLQTEDHDFPEIDHCLLPGLGPERAGVPLRLSIADAGAAPRLPVAERRLGEDVGACVEQLEEALAELPHAGEVMALVRAAYRPGVPLADAFAALLAELFAEHGLLIFNPRRPAVAALLAPLYRTALDGAAGISAVLEERGRQLAAAGFAEQVHVRPGSPLFFVHLPDAHGPRYRIDPVAVGAAGAAAEAAGFALVGLPGTLSRAEVRRIADEEPLRCSSSALLRPIAQDLLLPTSAYVGGPGEINYLVQSAAIYHLFDRRPPLFVHRARFRLSDARTRALLAELQLQPADAERPRAELLARLAQHAAVPAGVEELPSPEALPAELTADLLARLEALAPAAIALDPELARALRRTRATVERAASRLARRYQRALLGRAQLHAARLDRLLAVLHPAGMPQERALGVPWFAARVGPRALAAAVVAACEPLPFGAGLGLIELSL